MEHSFPPDMCLRDRPLLPWDVICMIAGLVEAIVFQILQATLLLVVVVVKNGWGVFG